MDYEICHHLKPVLDYALDHGNQVEDCETGWSDMKLVVNLRVKVNLNELRDQGLLQTPLSVWENTDPHYALQQGVSCEEHRHSIAWPLHDPTSRPGR